MGEIDKSLKLYSELNQQADESEFEMYDGLSNGNSIILVKILETLREMNDRIEELVNKEPQQVMIQPTTKEDVTKSVFEDYEE